MSKSKSVSSDISETKQPVLWMVATPLGNIEDITYRAVRILNEANLILAEDTRKTGLLLSHYKIETQQKSYRVHHIHQDTEYAVTVLKEGRSIAFCTDAGTPGISDPGSHLIRAVRSELPDVKIIPVPGASALTSALSVCGWQTNPFHFFGFLSPKSARRRNSLQKMSHLEGIIVLYESVHRIEKLLEEIFEIFPERDVLIAREITKIYEEYIYLDGKLTAPERRQILSKSTLKGEFTVLINSVSRKELTFTESE
jgi:16S rRNA (cytidine1402-2'-O)-methyltransferase